MTNTTFINSENAGVITAYCAVIGTTLFALACVNNIYQEYKQTQILKKCDKALSCLDLKYSEKEKDSDSEKESENIETTEAVAATA